MTKIWWFINVHWRKAFNTISRLGSVIIFNTDTFFQSRRVNLIIWAVYAQFGVIIPISSIGAWIAKLPIEEWFLQRAIFALLSFKRKYLIFQAWFAFLVFVIEIFRMQTLNTSFPILEHPLWLVTLTSSRSNVVDFILLTLLTLILLLAELLPNRTLCT